MPAKPEKPTLAIVDATAASYPSPPKKLNKPGASLWREIQAEYAVEDVGGRELLLQCCFAKDRLARLQAHINADGEIVRTPSGPKLHPAVAEERALRGFICRTLGKLGVTLESLKPIGRPPGAVGWTGDDDDADA
jgi:hypothetical protein